MSVLFGDELKKLFESIGTTKEDQQKEHERVENLLNDILLKYRQQFKDLNQQIITERDDIKSLKTYLGENNKLREDSGKYISSQPLKTVLNHLIERKEQLLQKQSAREAEKSDLLNSILSICSELELEEDCRVFQNYPNESLTQKDIDTLRTKLTQFSIKKKDRIKQINTVVEEIMNLFTILGETEETSHQVTQADDDEQFPVETLDEILWDPPKLTLLSSSFLKALENRRNALKLEKQSRGNLIQDLCGQIRGLYDKLNVSEGSRENLEFYMNRHYRQEISNLYTILSELKDRECEMIRQEIGHSQKELSTLLLEMKIDPDKNKVLCSSLSQGDISYNHISLLQTEISRIVAIKTEYLGLQEQIKLRDELFEEYSKVLLTKNDKSRYNDPRRLIREEKILERGKKLPLRTAQLKCDIVAFQDKNNIIVYNAKGEVYLDVISNFEKSIVLVNTSTGSSSSSTVLSSVINGNNNNNNNNNNRTMLGGATVAGSNCGKLNATTFGSGFLSSKGGMSKNNNSILNVSSKLNETNYHNKSMMTRTMEKKIIGSTTVLNTTSTALSSKPNSNQNINNNLLISNSKTKATTASNSNNKRQALRK